MTEEETEKFIHWLTFHNWELGQARSRSQKLPLLSHLGREEAQVLGPPPAVASPSYISRKLAQKWSSGDLNWCSDGMPVS